MTMISCSLHLFLYSVVQAYEVHIFIRKATVCQIKDLSIDDLMLRKRCVIIFDHAILLYDADRNITLRSSVQPEYFSDNNLTLLSSYKINTLFVKHYVKTNCAVLIKKTLFMRTLRLRIKNESWEDCGWKLNINQ